MAPLAADTAPPAQRQARRPLSRIVPAIPHRLSRSRNIPSARPITPDESNKGTPTKNAPEAQPVVEQQQAKEELPPQTAADAPMTPDSRASSHDKSDVEATVLATSPAKSADDHVELNNQHPGPPSQMPAPPVEEPASTPYTEDAGFKHKMSNEPTPSFSPNGDAKPATNGVSRKLAIPAHMPPPFYPSSKMGTHTPSVDGNDVAQAAPQRSQLSAGAAAFSVANGSPATPHEIDQDVHAQQPTVPRPPPGFSAPEHTASFFPGHSHHPSHQPSEVGGPWPYPSYGVPQPDVGYENGTDHHHPSYAVGAPAYPPDYDGSHTSNHATNGTTTVSPSKSQFGDAKSSSEREDEQRLPGYQNGLTSHASRFEESPFELAAYLFTQFGNPEFADFILQVRSPEAVLVSLPVHGIVVVRSPVIAEAVRRSMPSAHRSRDTRRMLDVVTSDPFVTREALDEAIKVLYGAPLLSAQGFLYGLAPYVYDGAQVSSNDARMRMRQLLSYISAGKALQLPSMQARGVEIVRSLLRWDTVEEVLQVALRSTTAFWPKKDRVDAEDPFTTALLNYAIDFMAYTFPVDFDLYTIAPELEDIPRLPIILEARSSVHNPRLSKIRFGDAPPEDDRQPTHVSRILSSVLLSLPLPLLNRLFNHGATANQVGWTGVVRIMRSVVSERESRRQKALKSEVRSAQDGTVPSALLNNMYFEESVEQVEESPIHPSGHRLVARPLPGHV
jgi:hypothetical protein